MFSAKPKPKWLSLSPQQQNNTDTYDTTTIIDLANNENSTTQPANYTRDPMFSIPFEDDEDINTTMQTNSKALKSGHNELDSAIITTTPIVPTAIIAAVNDDQIDHILGDNGQMATPMHIIANELNSNDPMTTLEHDLDNNSVISSTNAIITPTNIKRSRRKALLDFMYPRETYYPTDLFWTDPLIRTSPLIVVIENLPPA